MGGTLNAIGGGTMQTGGQRRNPGREHSWRANDLAGTTYTTRRDRRTYILGAINDKGTFQVNGVDGDNGIFVLTAATTLSGGGMVTMTSATGSGGAYVEAIGTP